MGGLGRTHQNRPHRQGVAQNLGELERDIGRVEVGHDQQVRLPLQPRPR